MDKCVGIGRIASAAASAVLSNIRAARDSVKTIKHRLLSVATGDPVNTTQTRITKSSLSLRERLCYQGL